MVFPPTHPMSGLTAVVEKTLSDIEFLSKKAFDGKLKTNEGTKADGATGDLATITASSGKDMYLAKAKVSARMDATNTSNQLTVELKVNGIVKATWESKVTDVSNVSDRGGASSHDNYEFVLSGLKVTAGQIIKLEVISSGSDTDISGELVCFEEPTGGDKTI